MNPVLREAASLASGGILLGIVTVAFFLFFTVVFFRLFRPSAQRMYAEVARLPLEGDTPTSPNGR
jgi:cbb3-type cytochrome oxidase subunit 3